MAILDDAKKVYGQVKGAYEIAKAGYAIKKQGDAKEAQKKQPAPKKSLGQALSK